MIFIGLGNPGTRYRSTRHNAGYLFVERMVRKHKKKFAARLGYKSSTLRVGREEMIIIKPICWMNQSGEAVRKILMNKTEDFLVILDDLNLPLGKIRVRPNGSDGGHLGLRSIIEALGSSDFPRLRIGIGPATADAVTYVLEPFTRQEKKILMAVIDKGIEGLEILVRKGFAKAQNFINSVNLSKI